MSEESPVSIGAGADKSELSDSVELHNELIHADEYSEYLLHQPREIQATLRKVAQAGDLITVYFNEGKDFLLTSLLDATDQKVLLDKGANPKMNLRALQADRLFCVTRHDKVKLQFLLTGIVEDIHDGQRAFSGELPTTLLRLQRREYFRLETSVTRPLVCQIPVKNEKGKTEYKPANVVDISAGGVAMLAPPTGLALTGGMLFENCTLDLPELGVVTTALRVCNTYDVTLRNGVHIKRAGCQFIGLTPAGQNMVQRYIIKIERERKARSSGLA
jgi:c-di-GMP-binding flagellar brake protein YcgR